MHQSDGPAFVAPDVSVIVPCYNAEDTIEATIHSVLSQTDVHLELIVVNDGSRDNSAAVVQAAIGTDRRARLVSQDNGGVAVARNSGLHECSTSSKFVMFLDADDMLVKNALSVLVGELEADEAISAVCGQCSRIDEDGKEISTAPTQSEAFQVTDHHVQLTRGHRCLDFWKVIPISPISTPGQVLIRRTALTESPFDPRCVPCEDWDLWLRLSSAAPIAVNESHVLAYRQRARSASRQYQLMRTQREHVFNKHYKICKRDHMGRMKHAYRFCMFQFDAHQCLSWAWAAIREQRPTDSARYAARAMRYYAWLLIAIFQGKPRLPATE